jgi:hypothetical protein
MADTYSEHPELKERDVLAWVRLMAQCFDGVDPKGTYSGDVVLDRMYTVWFCAQLARDTETFEAWSIFFTSLYTGKDSSE